ncbi:protein GrpE [Ornithinibacillus halotolerans]|uniref:Protein GrpE n=2 Tax=Ornithinibacillus halotolerans TaxID=1274357 RepID=A0A916RTI8_9BACI|nr:nucleotide exchange factor GrpE [Ornithinibacillus halotolerans]GGA68768.1 protein GrpE [Ornithinibacillus halotolerans]
MEQKDVTEQEQETVDEVEVKQEESTETTEEVIEEVEVGTNNQDEITKLQQEKDELYERLLRLQAEFDNFKKRSVKEREAERKYKAMDLASELLPAIDNFERALQVEETEANKGLLEGISMVYRQLLDGLKSQGVEVIEAVGKEFDPNVHQAVMQVEDENAESNVVVEELQKGYMIKDRVIRPAMVKVNK